MARNAAIASSHPAWDLDGQLHCECGHTAAGQAEHLEHVISAHRGEPRLAARILSARQYHAYLKATTGLFYACSECPRTFGTWGGAARHVCRKHEGAAVILERRPLAEGD